MQMMTLGIKDSYVDKFTALLDALPKDAVKRLQTKSMSSEVAKRVAEYKNGTMKTVAFGDGLGDMRANLAAKCK